MRHRVAGKKLNRDSQHRRALSRNLVTSLVLHGSITTTRAKAQVVQPQVDKLVTQAKKGALHSRRMVESFFAKKALANALVDTIAPKTGKRTSGFTRQIPLGRRKGDDAFMVRLEWVDAIDGVDANTEEIVSPEAAKVEQAKPAQKTPEKKTATKTASKKSVEAKDAPKKAASKEKKPVAQK